MPNLDGTGPQGQGPLTGRGRGRCQDTKTPKTEKSEATNENVENKELIYGLGRGGRPRGGAGNCFGNGFGQGAGRRNGRGRGREFGNR